MLKTCRYCGRCVPYDHDCKAKPKRTRYKREHERGRYTAAWTDKSLDIKARALFLCEVCKDNKLYVYKDLETHHIIPLKTRPDLLLEDSNLICVCSTCHTLAEDGKIEARYLMELAKKRDSQE